MTVVTRKELVRETGTERSLRAYKLICEVEQLGLPCSRNLQHR